MIGWVIGRCAPRYEQILAKDISDISKSAPIPTYVPVHVFFRSVSRYTPLRRPVRELIAPRMVFMQAGFAKIRMIESLDRGMTWGDMRPLALTYAKGQHVEGTIARVQRLEGFEGFVLGDDDWPYVIPHDTMTQFMIAVDRTNSFVEQMEREALGRINEAKKTTWRKLADETRDKLNYLLFGKYRD